MKKTKFQVDYIDIYGNIKKTINNTIKYEITV